MRISIFTKYIAKSLLTFFVAVVGILTLVIFMNHFIRVLNMAMAYGTGFGWIVSSLLNILPDVFCLSAPLRTNGLRNTLCLSFCQLLLC